MEKSPENQAVQKAQGPPMEDINPGNHPSSFLDPSIEQVNDQKGAEAAKAANIGHIDEMASSKGDDHQKPLKAKGLKQTYKNATNSSKINEAKEFLKNHDYDLELLLQQEAFLGYDKEDDYKVFVKKFAKNAKYKSSKGKTLSCSASEIQSVKGSHIDQDQTSAIGKVENPELPHPSPFIAIPQILIDDGAIIDHETMINYIDRFNKNDPLQRHQLLEEIVSRNTQSLFKFLEQLQYSNSSMETLGLFALLNELILNMKDLEDDSKSRIFLASLNFYQGQIFSIDQSLLRDSMQLLIASPNTKQALGLANFVFFNEIDCFTKQEQLIKKLDASHPGILQLMVNTWQHFAIDVQVAKLIPWSFFVLNKPFISVLKINNGLSLIRDIPAIYLQHFVKICAFANAPDAQALKDYISATRSTFLSKQEVLDKGVFQYFMKQLSEKLRLRDSQWVGKVEEIKKLQQSLVSAQIEKGSILSFEQLDNCLAGCYDDLTRVLQLPRAMQQLSEKEVSSLINLFKLKNSDVPGLMGHFWGHKDKLFEVNEVLQKIQNFLGFNLYASQILCLNWLNGNAMCDQFIQFGIGNGKTLLAATFAIQLCKTYAKSVFIVSKNEHLVQRDMKKYENLIKGMDLNATFNQNSKKLGVYYYTQSKLKKDMKNEKITGIWKDSFVIIDEYDWILFEGAIKTITENMMAYKDALAIFGFSGSAINCKEQRCIEVVFGRKPIVFPTLDQLKGNKKVQRADVLITSNKDQYTQYIKSIIDDNLKYAPIIIVASATYQTLEKWLQHTHYDFASLSRGYSQVVETIIEGRYLMKNSQQEYGIYLMNEDQGRGTDILTNDEIENNGGSYLIIADVFSKRSEEQIIGRVGRLNGRGTWQRVLYEQGSKDSSEQYIFTKQNISELQDDKRLAALQAALEEAMEKRAELSLDSSKSLDANANAINQLISNDSNEDKNQPANSELNNSSLEQQPQKHAEVVVNESLTQKMVPEEVKEEKECKLGFYQPSLIETVVNKMNKLPYLDKVPEAQIINILKKRSQPENGHCLEQNDLQGTTEVPKEIIQIQIHDPKKKRALKSKDKLNDGVAPLRKSQRAKVVKNMCEDVGDDE